MVEFEGRRLTGANFFLDEPAALIDAELPFDQQDEIVATWKSVVLECHEELGLPVPRIGFRFHAKGQSLFVTAPIDLLYSTIELGELALSVALGAMTLSDKTEQENENQLERLARLFKEEANPALITLAQAAEDHHVPFLWDDDFVSLGYGVSSRTWDIDQIPDPETLDWASFADMPLAFITGTNGKSTTTRLCSQILKGTGRTVGFSSTDGIWAGDVCLDRGDYSGPGGAREVLRNTNVDAAILEVARGGLLRRGLGAEDADAALITNVAEDHLGEYGVNTLEELIEAKFIVAKSLKPGGKLVLNADDPGVVRYSEAAGSLPPEVSDNIVWFSLDRNNPIVVEQAQTGRAVFYVEENKIRKMEAGQVTDICEVDEIGITLGGAARHNVANALAASALCCQLGVDVKLVREGLVAFDGNRDNPGRGNLRHIHGVSVMVDFAHNPHGLNAVVDTVLKMTELKMPAKRYLVMLGHAGDRSDEDIRELTNVACRLHPEQFVIFELAEYLRGREPGEIPNLISRSILENGYTPEQISFAVDPAEGAQKALDWAQAGDFLLLLALGDRGGVFDILDRFEQSE